MGSKGSRALTSFNQVDQEPDGSVRRELRHPDDVRAQIIRGSPTKVSYVHFSTVYTKRLIGGEGDVINIQGDFHPQPNFREEIKNKTAGINSKSSSIFRKKWLVARRRSCCSGVAEDESTTTAADDDTAAVDKPLVRSMVNSSVVSVADEEERTTVGGN